MIFGLIIIAIFVGVSVYFFFRAEGLQRQLITAKRDSQSTQKENKAYFESMALISKRHEDFVKERLNKLIEQQGKDALHTITPFINNYSVIFRECLKGKGKLHVITKKCYESYDVESFKEFTQFLTKQEAHIKRMWSSNNLSGFISLAEALLVLHDKENSKAA
jgi:hypothetical protein